MTGKKLYKESSTKYCISQARRICMAHSNDYLCLPCNEKMFNLERVRYKNKLDKHFTIDDYDFHMQRDDKTDRMKKARHIGTKQLRRYLKSETKQLIKDSFYD